MYLYFDKQGKLLKTLEKYPFRIGNIKANTFNIYINTNVNFTQATIQIEFADKSKTSEVFMSSTTFSVIKDNLTISDRTDIKPFIEGYKYSKNCFTYTIKDELLVDGKAKATIKVYDINNSVYTLGEVDFIIENALTNRSNKEATTDLEELEKKVEEYNEKLTEELAKKVSYGIDALTLGITTETLTSLGYSTILEYLKDTLREDVNNLFLIDLKDIKNVSYEKLNKLYEKNGNLINCFIYYNDKIFGANSLEKGNDYFKVNVLLLDDNSLKNVEVFIYKNSASSVYNIKAYNTYMLIDFNKINEVDYFEKIYQYSNFENIIFLLKVDDNYLTLERAEKTTNQYILYFKGFEGSIYTEYKFTFTKNATSTIEVNSQDLVNKVYLNNLLESYYLKVKVDEKVNSLQNQITENKENIEKIDEDTYKKTYIDNLETSLKNLIDLKIDDEVINNYYTKSEIDKTFEETTTDFDNALTNLENTLQNKINTINDNLSGITSDSSIIIGNGKGGLLSSNIVFNQTTLTALNNEVATSKVVKDYIDKVNSDLSVNIKVNKDNIATNLASILSNKSNIEVLLEKLAQIINSSIVVGDENGNLKSSGYTISNNQDDINVNSSNKVQTGASIYNYTSNFYALQNNVYSKTEIDALFKTLKQGSYKRVDVLPETGEEGILYLVGAKTASTFQRYIWEDEQGAFIDFGSTKTDLSNYVAGTNLITDKIIFGNGGSNIKSSEFIISKTFSNSETTIPTMSAIYDYLVANYVDKTSYESDIQSIKNSINTNTSDISDLTLRVATNEANISDNHDLANNAYAMATSNADKINTNTNNLNEETTRAKAKETELEDKISNIKITRSKIVVPLVESYFEVLKEGTTKIADRVYFEGEEDFIEWFDEDLGTYGG